ncbi:MAG: ATP-binding protein [Chlamydiae bacterium]|nr:ATP-binding protein [Chlamydiota bacterium]
MKRLVDKELTEWKHSSIRKSLILRGARQVGKTFAVRKLGKSYEDFYEINLEKRLELRQVFEKNLDPVRILRELSVDRGAPIQPGKTLLFIDEIQGCPQALLALRYFYEDMPKLHVIAAGSLLEFAIEQVGIPVGRVQSLTLFPMSFAEFLVAKKHTMMLEAICQKAPFSKVIHDKAIQLLSEYFVIGGLPEVVSNWVDNENPLEVKDKLSTIINTYKQDFEKYAKKSQFKYLNLLLQHIPLRLGGKFKFQGIGEYRKRELAPCLELLEKAHIIHMIHHTSGQGIPIGSQADLERYKVILFDIAVTQQLLGLDLKGWFLNPEEEFVNQGQLVKSFIGQEIMAYSSPDIRNNLYYWQREARGSEAKVDYLSTLKGMVIPIEVKAGKGSALKSLHSFLASHPKSPYGIKLSLAERSQFDKILAIPLYAAFEIVEGGIERVQHLLT